MAPEDLRLRFFVPLRELSPKLLQRLTNPDPAREAAIVVHPENAPDILAVGRLGAEEGSRSAEFALTVRTDMKGHGLGYMLLGRLIDVARQRGYAEIFGLVLHENARMLQMCREYGFKLMDDLDDPGVVRAVKRLD
jgi:acetyltransferase